MLKIIFMSLKKSFAFTLFVFLVSPHVSAQSLSDQFKENERKQDLNKMKREDSAFIKEEMLRRQGISPEQLKANGKILKCTFPGSLSSQFDAFGPNGSPSDIWRVAGRYVLIDGKIVDPKARTGESFESWAVAPKVVGSLINDNGIFKTKFTDGTSTTWEINLESRASFIALSERNIYRAECFLAPYVAE